MSIENTVQRGDWKGEKHVPFIDAPAKAKKDEKININVAVGREIPHPNTAAHHISWIEVYFTPDGSKFPIMLGRFGFLSHGAGDNEVYTEPDVKFTFKAQKSGTISAISYCNIHGLWASDHHIEVE